MVAADPMLQILKKGYVHGKGLKDAVDGGANFHDAAQAT